MWSINSPVSFATRNQSLAGVIEKFGGKLTVNWAQPNDRLQLRASDDDMQPSE